MDRQSASYEALAFALLGATPFWDSRDSRATSRAKPGTNCGQFCAQRVPTDVPRNHWDILLIPMVVKG